MSSSEYQLQVKQLEEELGSAEQQIRKLETEQRQQIDELQADYKARLGTSSISLFQLIKSVREIDTLLLEQYGDNRRASELEDYLEDSDNTIISRNQTVKQSFQELDNRLTEGRKLLMKEQERATEHGTLRMRVLSGKIEKTQSDVNQKITATEKEIETASREKEDATKREAHLRHEMKGMEEQLQKLDVVRGTVIGTTVGGSVMAVIGAFITPIFPPAGIGMIAAGSSMAVGSGISIADTEGKMNRTRDSISNTKGDIERLKKKIESLVAKVPRLRTDRAIFDDLTKRVKSLSQKATSVQKLAHQHIESITAAKEAISDGQAKITELGVDIQQLGYAESRERLARTLEAVVEKFCEGRLKLDGGNNVSEIEGMRAMVKDVAGETSEVLAIMG